MVALFLKCLIGAAAVMLIAILSKSKNFFIAGLVPLFPSFALIAHYIVATERNMEALRMTALFGLYSLMPYAAYLIAVYYFSYHLSVMGTLLSAVLVWVMFAYLLLMVWVRNVVVV